jgi:hypothetical protein
VLKIFPVCIGLGLLTGCSYSINMVHTEGTATDVVDATQTPTADVDASVPISGL